MCGALLCVSVGCCWLRALLRMCGVGVVRCCVMTSVVVVLAESSTLCEPPNTANSERYM